MVGARYRRGRYTPRRGAWEGREGAPLEWAAMNDAAPAAPFPGNGGRAGRSGADERPGPEVRPAATVMLVRAQEAPLEVLMLRRHPQSVFAADAWVFPGGRVDESDGAVGALRHGPTEAQASAALGLSSGGLAFWVAAARECFEEAGILLARRAGDGEWVLPTGELEAARFARHRRDVHTGCRSLAEVLSAEDLVLDLGQVHYVSHWITPPGNTRRFDTRFFLAAAPPGQVAAHDTSETVESCWSTPAEALARHAAGEIHLVFPTIKNLEALAQFRSAADVLEAARATARLSPESPCPT
jgi:8-oxo-dGTP pyrophosphatase MutT (NUDIX family)